MIDNCTPNEEKNANFAIAKLASSAAIAIDNLSLGREYDQNAITDLVKQAANWIPEPMRTRLLTINIHKTSYTQIKELRTFCVDLSRRFSALSAPPWNCGGERD